MGRGHLTLAGAATPLTPDAIVRLEDGRLVLLDQTLLPGERRENSYDDWPEMVDAMNAAGFANYTLFRRGLEVIAYCECEPDVETCFARFAEHGVGERWQAAMEGMVLGLTDSNGELVRYEEDWHLD